MSTLVKLKDHPEVARIIRAADRSYKKHNAYLITASVVELHGTYWDGGSRSTYTAVDMVTFKSQGAPQYNPPQFGGPKENPQITIPPNVAIVRTGISRSDTATAFVYVNEANATKFLPAPVTGETV